MRQRYLEWVEQQIEAYKETISRDELLSLADTVVSELRVNRRGQYQLTEVLLCDAVDRKIYDILRLPSYRVWRQRLRAGQNLYGEESKPSLPEAASN